MWASHGGRWVCLAFLCVPKARVRGCSVANQRLRSVLVPHGAATTVSACGNDVLCVCCRVGAVADLHGVVPVDLCIWW